MRKLIAFLVRREACKMAALAIRTNDTEQCVPLLWSLTVFFESYLWYGSEGTHEEFGPKAPVELKEVS